MADLSQRCPTCGGSGRIQPAGYGGFVVSQWPPCWQCEGEGWVEPRVDELLADKAERVLNASAGSPVTLPSPSPITSKSGVGLIQLVATLETALRAVLVMWDRGPEPKKLDAALGWRANDEYAHSLADAALYAVARFRRENGTVTARRETREVADK